jgi:predicted nuclease with TOPRIM domain
MDDIVRTTIIDELENKVINRVTYDNSAVLAQNAIDRQDRTGQKYQGNLCHVGRVHLGDIERLKNMGYDLLSTDTEEVRRALCYIQANEPHLLTVEGKPFAMHRNSWH